MNVAIDRAVVDTRSSAIVRNVQVYARTHRFAIPTALPIISNRLDRVSVRPRPDRLHALMDDLEHPSQNYSACNPRCSV